LPPVIPTEPSSSSSFCFIMKLNCQAALAVVGVLLGFASGLPFSPGQAAGVISAPIRRSHLSAASDLALSRLRRRGYSSGVDPIVLKNYDSVLYSADSNTEKSQLLTSVTIGTPPQKLTLQIDTGSSDLWVEFAGSSFCESEGNPCSASGTYDNTTSSTYDYLNSLFDIQYGDSTQAVGDYATETFQIGGNVHEQLR
jgi:hypothetical protein